MTNFNQPFDAQVIKISGLVPLRTEAEISEFKGIQLVNPNYVFYTGYKKPWCVMNETNKNHNVQFYGLSDKFSLRVDARDRLAAEKPLQRTVESDLESRLRKLGHGVAANLIKSDNTKAQIIGVWPHLIGSRDKVIVYEGLRLMISGLFRIPELQKDPLYLHADSIAFHDVTCNRGFGQDKATDILRILNTTKIISDPKASQ